VKSYLKRIDGRARSKSDLLSKVETHLLAEKKVRKNEVIIQRLDDAPLRVIGLLSKKISEEYLSDDGATIHDRRNSNAQSLSPQL
jgi:hypothetical protein